MATVQEKSMCVLWFFETKSVITTQRRFRTTYKEDPFTRHNLRELVAFFTEREREDRALRRKMLIASKKRLLAVHAMFVKNIVYKTPVPSLDELKRRIVTAIQNVTPQMLENTWREIEFRLEVLRATKGSHVQIH
ncbi:hypothetical protein AVEN_141640-1 [Araneus ventricosus]|uniref:Uncharacterized protein n=1 Tax=Araneus ventricosus TaxID=182803 RepID=A0A4Y2SHD1_ARAVE|nr:hypothetical protein AVEN_207900-1 [Araneus ventricosus]GBN87183.1 hypothetical protein AVEN_85711-1 [Araneus ventricosus]GBN87202.1 hypothetical protein AVEN_70150-1 [Araneus ventricosus]GBN87223.1 hypothetical protein AVEN_141640-1 [Araneus ventricosus]